MINEIETDALIIKQLGKGGFGEVYLIQKNEKYFALKKIPKSQLNEKKIDEINDMIIALSKLNNEHIIKYYDSIIEKDFFCILMEYGGDLNLKQFIKLYRDKNQLIEENIILDIIKQICSGLIEIHKLKFIHRDLTPDNIFIDNNKKIKIGDFGISVKLTTNNIYANSKVGKYHYFAPEIEKKEKYNNKVDIYSLGCVIYELFTLNEYYLDKYIYKKEIDLEIYNQKWQEIIKLLLKDDYHKRPSIEEAFNYIKEFKNEITLIIKIKKYDVGEKYVF